MKKVYADYCMLVSFEVDDETSEEEITELVANEYAKRGISDMSDFDDGEISIIPVK